VKGRLLLLALVAAVVAEFAGSAFGASASESQANTAVGSKEPEMGVMIGTNEMVMLPMSQITATTPVGTITITAGEGFRRCYSWEEATGCVNLDARNERWHGSLGAASYGTLQFWRDYQGVDRGVTDEGQHNFSTIDEFREWLLAEFGTVVINLVSPVYRDDGLLVGWLKGAGHGGLGHGGTLGVWVEQIYINGRKPTKLPGSQNDKIVVKMVDELPKDNMRKTFLFF
jgi:hypothetical protein